jgi:hypothetical protein
VLYPKNLIENLPALIALTAGDDGIQSVGKQQGKISQQQRRSHILPVGTLLQSKG